MMRHPWQSAGLRSAEGRGSSGGAPRYMRLAQELARRIADGEFYPGDALPAERRIAELHDVSRVTVRRALEQLAADGLVEARHGSGTFVAQRLRQPLRELTGLSEDVRARGLVLTSTVLDRGIGVPTSEEMIGLGLSSGDRVTRLKRLRLADGSPLAVEASAIPRSILPDPETIGDSLYETLAKDGNRPVRAIQRLTSVAVDSRTASLLDVAPGSPATFVIRVGYRADDRPVEYTLSHFRGDRWDFVTEMVGQ